MEELIFKIFDEIILPLIQGIGLIIIILFIISTLKAIWKIL